MKIKNICCLTGAGYAMCRTDSLAGRVGISHKPSSALSRADEAALCGPSERETPDEGGTRARCGALRALFVFND